MGNIIIEETDSLKDKATKTVHIFAGSSELKKPNETAKSGLHKSTKRL